MLNFLFFFQAEDGIRDLTVTGVQTCALPISHEMLARIAAARGDFVTARREAELARSDFVLAQVLLAQNDPAGALTALRSEERRVGKEWRSGCSPWCLDKTSQVHNASTHWHRR